jgi:hypothetical protein
VREVAETRAVKIGCDVCFERLDRFVEMRLSGMDAAQGISLVQEYLKICDECREEFGALPAAL